MGEAKFRARCSTNAISSLLKHISLHDNLPDNSQLPDSSPTADPSGGGGSMPSPPFFLRRDAQTLAAIRSLPRTANLVLFAPVAPPEDLEEPLSPAEGGAVQDLRLGKSRADADAPMDPFEPLGRALSRHHSRIRHVPYVPSVGMTGTHQAFLEHAAAVVLVVVCKRGCIYPPPPSFGSPAVSSGFAVQQTESQPGSYRSPYALPPLRSPSAMPAQVPVKMEPRLSPLQLHARLHRPVQRSPSTSYASSPSSTDQAFKFATQTLLAAWERRQHLHTTSGGQSSSSLSTLPTLLLVIDDDAQFEDQVMRLDALLAERVAGSGEGGGDGSDPGARTVLRSGSYSPRALRRVAGLVFGSEM